MHHTAIPSALARAPSVRGERGACFVAAQTPESPYAPHCHSERPCSSANLALRLLARLRLDVDLVHRDDRAVRDAEELESGPRC